jgi:hypothetical protein
MARVRARFDLGTPGGSPFPSDLFTVQDSSHNTGRRVNLPKPDCTVRPSDCEDLDVINTLDGFNLQPRMSIPFDGTIDPATVRSDTVFLVSLGDVSSYFGDRSRRGRGRRVDTIEPLTPDAAVAVRPAGLRPPSSRPPRQPHCARNPAT